MTEKKRYLKLSDGSTFTGYAFGADDCKTGELVFTTGMCGYIETLTDPSYYGQIVLQTFPLIGNYGIIEEDFEGKCAVSGYIVKEYCSHPSNFRSQYTLDEFLKKNGVPGIYGLDTRHLTKLIRTGGVPNAIITDDPEADISALFEYKIKNALAAVSIKKPCVLNENGRFKVALIDYGAKRNIARELIKRDCAVTQLPHDVTAKEILSGNFSGVMLSNGPGDPAENVFQIGEIEKLLGKLPIFGICLGHQLLALASGAKTQKLKYGHRGVNQPVKEIFGTRTFITSQNHGYAVEKDSLKSGVISYINANDGTCEGIDYPEKKAFSVQFHPEACSGPKDTSFLFDRFIKLMEEN